MIYLKRFWIGLVLFFGWSPVATEPEPIAVKKPKLIKDFVQNEFYFRETILDQLDEYFKIVKRMKRYDPDAYVLYSRVGAHILPLKFGIDDGAISPWWLKNRPAFGATGFLNIPGDEDAVFPKFLYFQKYTSTKAPPGVQRCNGGDVYIVTVYWDEAKFGGIPAEFPVLVSFDGKATILKTLMNSSISIRSKRGKQRSYSIPQKRWGIHPFFKEWASERQGRSAEEHLLQLFVITANLFEATNSSMIRVDARQGSVHAVFGVSVTRTPYFFKDREVRLGQTGRRKRIFHIVKTHQRKTGAIINMHFRGEREFLWNKYYVCITVPGKDHPHLPSFNASAQSLEREAPTPKGMVEVEEVARLIRKSVDERSWANPTSH